MSGVGEGQRDVGNLLEERYNEGSRAIRVRPSSAPPPGDVPVSQAPDPGLFLAMGPNQFFRKLFGQVNLGTTMLFKSYNETKLLSESIIGKINVILKQQQQQQQLDFEEKN